MTNDSTAKGLLRSIGNRFKRPDAEGFDGTAGTSGDEVCPSFVQAFLPMKRHGEGGGDLETPDLYYEDRPLGVSIHALEQIRLALRHLTSCSNEHSQMLVSSAHSQNALGDALVDAMHPSEEDASQDADLTDLAVSSVRADGRENLPPPHFSACLSLEAIEAQMALGRGMIHLAEVSTKLSVAISKPINDLTKSFEDRYTRKIVPLRRRYIDQKGQYLKYKRNADMADTDEKRSYFEALAEAAKPVWLRTSTELRTEADVMTELTAKNMTQWSRTITLQHERAFAISAANMAEAFTRAKELPSLGKPQSNA